MIDVVNQATHHTPHRQSEHSIPQPNDSWIILNSNTELTYKHFQLNLKHILP